MEQRIHRREGAFSLAAGIDTQEVSVDKTLDVARNRSRAVLANSKNDDKARRPVRENTSPKRKEVEGRKGGKEDVLRRFRTTPPIRRRCRRRPF